MESKSAFTQIELIYDGECPVCTTYVKMHRLRENSGRVLLTDARKRPEIVRSYIQRGVDLNRDFVLKLDGVEYIGGDAMFALSSIAAPYYIMRKTSALMLASKTTSRAIYGALRIGRWTLLYVTGKKPINSNSLTEERET